MKLNKGYRLREVAGEYMLICDDVRSVDFNRIYSLSETAAWLWNVLVDRDFSFEDALGMVLSEYDVEEEVARTDLEAVIGEWIRSGMAYE